MKKILFSFLGFLALTNVAGAEECKVPPPATAQSGPKMYTITVKTPVSGNVLHTFDIEAQDDIDAGKKGQAEAEKREGENAKKMIVTYQLKK